MQHIFCVCSSVDSHDVGSVSVTAWPAEDHFIANTVTNSQVLLAF